MGLLGGLTRGAAEDSTLCFVMCVATCMLNGVLYSMPLFTHKMLDMGLQPADIVICGVLLQLGYGACSYPFSRFYRSSSIRLGLAGRDRATNALACGLILLGLGVQLVVAVEGEQTGQANVLLFKLAFFLWGLGLGLSFYHSLSLVNFIFAASPSARRRAGALMMFALGIGSVVFTVMYKYVLSGLTLSQNFGLLIAVYGVSALFRLKYMARAHFQEVPSLELPASLMGSSSSSSSTRASRMGSDADLSERGARADTSDSAMAPLDIESTPAQGPQSSSLDAERGRASSTASNAAAARASAAANALTPVTFRDYLFNRVVVLTAISTFFTFGVGATFFSSLGNLAQSIVPEADVDSVTFTLTFVFLCLIIVSRLVTTVIYAHFDWPYVMVLWQASLVLGVLVYTVHPTLRSAYVASAFIGLGFGGISSCPVVIASANFPGGIAEYSLNLSVAVTLMSTGPFLVGYIQTVIYEAPSLAWFGSQAANENLSVFLYFLGASLFGAGCSLLLGFELQKRAKSRAKLAAPSSSGHSQAATTPQPPSTLMTTT